MAASFGPGAGAAPMCGSSGGEPGPDGKRRHRRIVLGSVNQFADRSAAFRATRALRRDINLASRRRRPGPLTLTELADHYCQRELSAENQWKTYSTKLTYRGYLRKWKVLAKTEAVSALRHWIGRIA
jgi:hypothetical protein